jgi:hypothetical protein
LHARVYTVSRPSHYRAGLGPPIVYRTQSVLSETNAKGASPLYPTFDSHSSGTSTGNPADQAGRIGIHNLDSTFFRQFMPLNLVGGQSRLRHLVDTPWTQIDGISQYDKGRSGTITRLFCLENPYFWYKLGDTREAQLLICNQ